MIPIARAWPAVDGAAVRYFGMAATPTRSGDDEAVGARLVPDETYPGMWRIRFPDGSLSDLANRTRADEALRLVRKQERARKAPP